MQPDYVVVADLIRERDEAREQVRALHTDLDETHADLAHRSEQVRSLTVERDRVTKDLGEALAEREQIRSERDDCHAAREAASVRLSRAREALGRFWELHTSHSRLSDSEVFEKHAALAALRAALAEPLGGP